MNGQKNNADPMIQLPNCTAVRLSELMQFLTTPVGAAAKGEKKRKADVDSVKMPEDLPIGAPLTVSNRALVPVGLPAPIAVVPTPPAEPSVVSPSNFVFRTEFFPEISGAAPLAVPPPPEALPIVAPLPESPVGSPSNCVFRTDLVESKSLFFPEISGESPLAVPPSPEASPIVAPLPESPVGSPSHCVFKSDVAESDHLSSSDTSEDDSKPSAAADRLSLDCLPGINPFETLAMRPGVFAENYTRDL